MLTPWLELPGAETLLREFSAAAGQDLIAAGTEADDETLRDTAIAQPLIVAASLLSAHQLGLLTASAGPGPGEVAPHPSQLIAGHSVGEFAAAAIAGVLTPQTALELIQLRGRAMAAAAAEQPTGMAAVVGGKTEDVSAAIAEAQLVEANINGASQVVAAGSKTGLAYLSENPPAKARVIELSVAGAFHTELMASAQTALAAAAGTVAVTDPHSVLLSNRDGQPVSSGRMAIDNMVEQITRAVRWDSCMETMLDQSVTGLLELSPAGTLAGLAKRGMRGVETFALSSPDDLDAAKQFIDKHRGSDGRS